MPSLHRIFQLRKFLKLFSVTLSIFALCITTAFAAGTPPTTAPVISLVTRGVDFLEIDFTNGPAQGATKYQYSLDAGVTWVNTVATGGKVKVRPVDRSVRAQVSLRGVNEFGYGPASQVYKTTRVLFIGASITEGARVFGNSWARLSASALGWQYTNLATHGTGYMIPAKNEKSCSSILNFASQATCGVAWNPDIVIVSGGSNDCKYVITKQGRRYTKAKIKRTLAYTKSYFPNAEIIVTPVISPLQPSCLKVINNWIAASAASTGISFVSGADTWLSGKKEFASSDGIHPNQDGHNYAAGLFVAWYKKLHKLV